MKSNRWTVVMAAASLIILTPVLPAEEQAPNPVLTALASTSLSGYVDTSAQWNAGTGNANTPPYMFGGPAKADGFNLNVVDLALDKPLDDTRWAAGYHAEFWFGPDANVLFTQSTGIGADIAVRQAYVLLRTPLGNGIEWKLGVFDPIIGFEAFNSPNNPHYTRSYGFSIEPLQHTGLLGTYTITDGIVISAGVANTLGPTINGRAASPYDGTPNESYKTYMASIALTAPEAWGWLAGSTFSAGVVNGFNGLAVATTNGARQTSVYAGAVLTTPVTGWKLGAALDFLDVHDAATLTGTAGDGTIWAGALYSSYQATDKLSFHVRGEWVYLGGEALNPNGVAALSDGNHLMAVTATAQYDLWANVLSRVEFRWDHAEHGRAFGGESTGAPDRANAYLLAANLIYKF